MLRIKFIKHLAFFFALLLQVPDVLAQCGNAGFENCNFTGWSGTTSKRRGQYCSNNPNKQPPCGLLDGQAVTGVIPESSPNPYRYKGLLIGPNNQASNHADEYSHVIMTGGNDAAVGAALPATRPGGGCSARLGNAIDQAGGETMSFSFFPTATDNSFTYSYAVVMNDPGATHNGITENYFKIRMWYFNSPTDSVELTCGAYNVTPSTASGFTNAGRVNGFGNENVLYKPWSSVTIPLDAYIGKRVKITFETRDCCPGCPGNPSGGSHWCYAYIDAECSNNDIVSSPPPSCAGPTTATLTAPIGAASYAWTGPGIVSGANQQAAVINSPGTYTVSMTAFGQAQCVYTRTVVVPGALFL